MGIFTQRAMYISAPTEIISHPNSDGAVSIAPTRVDVEPTKRNRSPKTPRIHNTRKGRGVVGKVLSSVSMTVAALCLLSSMSGGISVAFADETEDQQEVLKNAGDAWLGDDTKDAAALFNKLDDDPNRANPDTFGYVLNRLLVPSYINDVSSGYPSVESGQVCNVDAKGAGTALYHNCDVPNISAEFLQDIVSLFSQTGMVNAETTQNIAPFGFGLPSNMPKDGAPVNPTERVDKYTALELYGYNMRFQRYAGEWDHIKVTSAARNMANMGFLDQVGMAGNAIVNGITAGVNAANEQLKEGWKDGDYWKMLTAPFFGFAAGVTATIKSIMDTADLNVIQNYGWYRINYGNTLYNAREMNKQEIAAIAQSAVAAMFGEKSNIEKAGMRQELKEIESGPDELKKDISLCTIDGVDEKEGITKAACEALAKSKTPGKVEWKKDGKNRGETLSQWKIRNDTILKKGMANGMKIEIGDDESKKEKIVSDTRNSWRAEWKRAADSALAEDQNKIVSEWDKMLKDASTFVGFMMNQADSNFNAPWTRYVCTDVNGVDIKQNGANVRVMNSEGALNELCNEVRPPIQDGLFGNGYLDGQETPGTDTRNYGFFNPFGDYLINVETMLSNMGMSVTMFITQTSNTVLNLAFSPLLEELGLTKVIVNIIEGFRDGIFFPLAVLMIGLAAIYALYKAGTSRSYLKQIQSLLITVIIFILGVMLMTKPQATIDAVDKVPSMVEQAVVGLIFTTGNQADDFLCTATGTKDSGVSYKDLQGKTIKNSPNDGVRILMCENWRVFAFNPWVFGQWGTNYQNLYAENTTYDHRMSNTNTGLVGDAGVNMGGGITNNNWALYQLDASSSGTASRIDTANKNGGVSRDLYRIVDMQAGPNGAALSDGSYFNAWSGNQFGLRNTVAFLSTGSAIVGAVTVIAYSFTKIVISFVTTVMLLFMPLFFLIGLLPAMGRSQMKKYVGTILALMVQRVVLVMLLAIMMRMLTAFATATDNYFFSTFLTVAVCVIFLIYRKEILDSIFTSISQVSGGTVGQEFISNPEGVTRESLGGSKQAPGFLANKASQFKAGATGFAGGAIAGAVNGENVFASATAASRERMVQSLARQRSLGIGKIQAIEQGLKAGIHKSNESMREKGGKLGAYERSVEGDRKNQAEIEKWKEELRTYDTKRDGLIARMKREGVVSLNIEFKDDRGRTYYTNPYEVDKLTGEPTRFYKPEKPRTDSGKFTRKTKVAASHAAAQDRRLRQDLDDSYGNKQAHDNRPDTSEFRTDNHAANTDAGNADRFDNTSKRIVTEDHKEHTKAELKQALKDLIGYDDK